MLRLAISTLEEEVENRAPRCQSFRTRTKQEAIMGRKEPSD